MSKTRGSLRKNPRTIFNQRGASMIEVMVMSGVMVGMMTGFMSMMSQQSKSISYLEDRLSGTALESELRLRFSSPDYCKNFLSGLVAPLSNNVRDIASSSNQDAVLGTVFQKKGNKLFYDKLEIAKISMENSDLNATKSSGVMDLVFYPERSRKGGGPASLQPIKIRTAVSVGAGSQIQSCKQQGEGSGEGGLGEGCLIDGSAVYKKKVGCGTSILCTWQWQNQPVSSYSAGDMAAEGTIFAWSASGKDHKELCLNSKWVTWSSAAAYTPPPVEDVWGHSY